MIKRESERAASADSIATHSATLVARLLQVLDSAIASGQFDEAAQTAAKLVVASGVLSSVAEGPDLLERLVRQREQADRVRFLDKLEALGGTEAEWNAQVRGSAAPAPRGRPRKK